MKKSGLISFQVLIFFILRVLLEYFTIAKRDSIALPSDITGEKFRDLKYQIDAVTRAISILEQHNGVIIADVVGLGKSIIASAIAFNSKLRTIIICTTSSYSSMAGLCLGFCF